MAPEGPRQQLLLQLEQLNSWMTSGATAVVKEGGGHRDASSVTVEEFSVAAAAAAVQLVHWLRAAPPFIGPLG